MDQKIIDLYDEYTHRPLERRVFLERLTVLAGGAAAAGALLSLLENDYARAEVTRADDPALRAERATYPGAKGAVAAYFVRPRRAPAKGEAPGAAKTPEGGGPAVIVIHENRGLNAHIEDVARRFALAGFTTLAPDLLSPLGGTPKDEDKARELIGQLEPAGVVGDLKAAVAWLAGHPEAGGKVGAVGFCWGGGMVNQLALAEPKLRAGVVFYGMSPDASADVRKIRSPLLLHYAELDDRINASVPAYEAALKKAERPYTIHRYEGAQHAFHNDTNAARYNAEAARLAWERTVEFLRKHLA